MKKWNEKSDTFKKAVNYCFDIVGTRAFIFLFDILYLFVLIYLPFKLALLKCGYFSSISSGQMLSYIGSMATAFCTINLALLTYSFNVSTKKENENLKKRTFIIPDVAKGATFQRYTDSLLLQIPLKIFTDNLNGKIEFILKSVRFIANGQYDENFFKETSNISACGAKTYDTDYVSINVQGLELSKISAAKLISIHMFILVVNDGCESKNNLVISLEKEDKESNKYKILSTTNF